MAGPVFKATGRTKFDVRHCLQRISAILLVNANIDLWDGMNQVPPKKVFKVLVRVTIPQVLLIDETCISWTFSSKF